MSAAKKQTGEQKVKMLAGYGIGDFGLNIYWNSLSIWLVFWYTDVVGIAPETAGLIFLISTVWDAFTDPIVAGGSERVNSRFGTYRPFLLFGGPLLGGAFVLLFWVPPFTGTALIVCLALVAVFFRTAYTLVAIPYAAMSSRLTYKSVLRTELSGVRMFFAFAGLLLVSFFFPPLARLFSGGEEYTAAGFQTVVALGAVIATLAILSCFAFTREQPIPRQAMAKPGSAGPSLWNRFRQNRALVTLLFVIFLQSGANAALMISLVFFVEANKELFAAKEVVLTAFAIATMIGVPFWTLFARQIGKKKTWCISSASVFATGLHMLLFGPSVIGGVPLQLVVFGFCFGAFAVLLWSFIPDTVEYGQLKSGQRSEGLVFGSVLVVQKVTGGLMGVLVTQVLAAIGYNSENVQQGAEVGHGLIVFLSICPAIMLGLSVIPICLLPLNRHIHTEIVGKLSGNSGGTE